MSGSIAASELQSALAAPKPPLVIDVRPRPAFRAATDIIAGALWRDPGKTSMWANKVPTASAMVVYCERGHDVSRHVATTLDRRGLKSHYLKAGIEGWKASRGGLDRKPADAATRWVTRERPKIDCIACPWLISRFVDRNAEFLYVPANQVLEAARRRYAIPYDIPDVAFSHNGDLCSFDAFLKHYRLNDPALQSLAVIVRGADTARLELAPQAHGLAAISLGLSRIFLDDHEMLKHGMVMYDALYMWCKEGHDKILATWRRDSQETSPRLTD